MNSSFGTAALGEKTRYPGRENTRTYWDLYQAIDRGEGLSLTELVYLDRLVKRKLRNFDPRFHSVELRMKPYEQDEGVPEEYFQEDVTGEKKAPSFWEGASHESSASQKERRKHPRFKMRGTVIVKARSSQLPSGTITDISRSGLAFHYRDNGHNPYSIRKIDIIWADFVAAHQLRGLPVQTVSDVVLGYEDRVSATVIYRKRAVRFEDLSGGQAGVLDRLITACGAAAV